MNNYAGYGSFLEDWSNSTTDCSFPVGLGIALMMFYSVAAMLGSYWCFKSCIEPEFYFDWKISRRGSFLFCLSVSSRFPELIVPMVCRPLFVVIIGKRALAGDCSPNLELAYVVSSNLSFSTSVMHFAATIVDHFLSAFLPLHQGRIMQKCNLKAMLIAVWGASFAFNFCFFRVPFNKETSSAVLVSFVVTYSPVIGCYYILKCFVWKMERRATIKHLSIIDDYKYSRYHLLVASLLVSQFLNFLAIFGLFLEIYSCQHLVNSVYEDRPVKLGY